MVQSVQISGQSPKMTRVNNLAISFTKEDVRLLHHPYDDALVINLSIANFNTQQVLVDNGSSKDNGIDKKRLLPSNTPLVEFGSTKVFPIGTITLPVTIRTYLQQLTKEVTFLVVDCSSAYNTIIGWPTLYSWRVAMSTYHLLVKFPTEYGIRESRGDLMADRKCYIAMLEMDDRLWALNIEEKWVTVESMEDLEEISLDNNFSGQIIRISTQADPSVPKKLALFLKNN